MLHLVRSYTAFFVCVCVCVRACVCVGGGIYPTSDWQMSISESCTAQWVKSASEPGQTHFPSTLTISVSKMS